MDSKSCFPILAMFLFTPRFRLDLSGIMQEIVTCAWEEIIALIMPPASHNLAQQWSILLLTGHGVHYLFPNAKNTRVGLIKHSHKDELSRFPLSRRFHSVTQDPRERERENIGFRHKSLAHPPYSTEWDLRAVRRRQFLTKRQSKCDWFVHSASCSFI